MRFRDIGVSCIYGRPTKKNEEKRAYAIHFAGSLLRVRKQNRTDMFN